MGAFGTVGSAFGTGMRAATSFAHKAADIGSDVLGGAGVGSPGYSMTPTDERYSRTGGSRSAGGGNGTGGDPADSGGDSGPNTPPLPPTPPVLPRRDDGRGGPSRCADGRRQVAQGARRQVPGPVARAAAAVAL
jgi:hypothetical protein